MTPRSQCVRKLASEILPILSLLSLVFMSWKTLALFADSPKPVMVVISESMAPAFHRGDIILLWNRTPIIKVGDIPVVWFPGRSTPMVHRAVKRILWQREAGRIGQTSSSA